MSRNLVSANDNLAAASHLNKVHSAITSTSDEIWDFAVGEWVTHRDQPMPSLVMSRQRTGKGIEIYSVRSFADVDPVRDRVMLGEVLRPIDADGWANCLMPEQLAKKVS